MLPVYLGSLALGGLLIVASIFLGGHDHDADADVDAHVDVDVDIDVDVDVDADADADLDGGLDHDLDKDVDLAHLASDSGGGTWLPFLSMRFWTFALAVFGATGSLLQLVGFSDMVSAPTSALTGVGVGWGVALAFHKLKKDKVTGDVGLRGLVGREGRLLLPVGPDKPGKVRVQLDGQDVDLVARTHDGKLLAHRQPVLIVEVQDGVAEVTSLASSRDPTPP